MVQNSKKERIQKAYNYLFANGLIHSVTDLANKLGRARPGVNNAMNGDLKYLNDTFIKHFVRTFPIFSLKWLLTGDGNMLLNESSEVKESPVVSSCDREVEYLRSQLELSGQRIADLQKTISTQETLIAVLQARIADLQTSEPFFFTPGVAEVTTKTRK